VALYNSFSFVAPGLTSFLNKLKMFFHFRVWLFEKASVLAFVIVVV